MVLNPVKVLSKYTQEYGDTFRFYIGGIKEAIVTTNPYVIQHVLKTNAENYQKSEIQVERMGHFLGKGLLTTHGEAWRTQRRLIQKGFDRKQLEALSAIMQDSLAESLKLFEKQVRVGSVDIYPHLMKMTFSMVARSLFGAKLKDEDIDMVSHTICTVQEFIVRQTLQPYMNPWFAVSGDLRKHEEMRARADSILMAYIKQRRHQEPGHDLLQTLMDARYSDGEGMSDELVLSESMQLLVAGHETSSNALSWLFYLLSTRPDCLERVREEFDSIIGDAPLNYTDVPRFEFTSQVISEALRLYPPFWMIDRMAVADDQAGDVAIPSGSTVIVYVYGAHHAPKYWQNPETFDPARFTKANEKLQPPFTYLPFGGGPRGCIGGNFAMLQILMILSVLLRKYDFQLAPGQQIEARPMVILRPKNGIKMTFTEKVARDQHAVLQN
ncbi:MAG: cytochrome P450 [Terracidiphilus sp.]|jgi:cytochrome P450